jgi:hypothetical protein
MSSIFPGSASVGQIFEGYLFNGIAWDLIGNEFNPTTFSPTAPDNPKSGDLWVDSDSNVPSISNETILTIDSASATYLTKTSASTTYATKAELENIDLSSASAAAVAAIVDSAPSTLNTLNELAAALNDDASFASTVTTSLSGKQKTIPFQSSAPLSPSTGDIWMDSTNIVKPVTKVYNGSTWIIASGQAEASIHPFFLAGI